MSIYNTKYNYMLEIDILKKFLGVLKADFWGHPDALLAKTSDASVCTYAGTDISTCPASEFLEKKDFGQVHFSLHLPEWASLFSEQSTHFYVENGKHT